MVYNPGGVSVPVEIVRKAWPGGVTESGLTEHCGVPAGCAGVTVQGTASKETGLSKVPTGATLMVAVEDPPGSTAEGDGPLETSSVNSCP
jgi:hypothetical protein